MKKWECLYCGQTNDLDRDNHCAHCGAPQLRSTHPQDFEHKAEPLAPSITINPWWTQNNPFPTYRLETLPTWTVYTTNTANNSPYINNAMSVTYG